MGNRQSSAPPPQQVHPPPRGGRSGSGSGSGDSNPPTDASRARSASAADAADYTSDDAREEPAVAGGPNVLYLLRHGYSAVVDAFIRPPRVTYDVAELGPPLFDFRGRRFQRTDLTLKNARGLKLVCSWWGPVEADRPAAALPCIVFLHGNSACRVAALEALEVVLAEGATLFTLDFSGCGQSEGEWVTLGWYERDDLAAVMAFLREAGGVGAIACWGRSMGAATALLHSHRDPSIAGLVLDSSFADLEQLCRELVASGVASSGYRVPSFLISAALRMIRSSVKKKSGLDIFALKPIADVDKAFIPAVREGGMNYLFNGNERTLTTYLMGSRKYSSLANSHSSHTVNAINSQTLTPHTQSMLLTANTFTSTPPSPAAVRRRRRRRLHSARALTAAVRRVRW